jgi:histidinol-phosphate aminotransferase
MNFHPPLQALPHIEALKPYVPGKAIEALAREQRLTDIIKLASNESALGPSLKVFEAIQQAMHQAHRYPDADNLNLKSALCAHLNLEPSQIILGNGSDEILQLIHTAFIGPSHAVIYSQYSFASYEICAQTVGAQKICIPAIDWNADLNAMQAAITPHTRLICLANPNNPTGTELPIREIKKFLEGIPQSVLFLLDQAYFEYHLPEYNYLPWLQEHPNLILLRTFSKAYGLAGLRVGYGMAHADVVARLDKVRSPFHVNRLAESAAIAALKDTAHLQKVITDNQEQKQYLYHALEKRGLCFIPSAANFITVHIVEADRIYQALLSRGIIVRPLKNYGLDQHLRISIGRLEENQALIHALETLI